MKKLWFNIKSFGLVLFALIGLLLQGCAGGPNIVRVPVPAPCYKSADVPPETPLIGELPTDARAAAEELAAKLLEVRGENGLLRAIVKGCPGE